MFAVNDEEGSAGFLPSRQANEQAPRGFTRWHGQFQLYFGFSRIPTCIGLLESVLRAVVNRSGSPAVFVAEWRAGLLTISWPLHSHEGEFEV